MNIEQLYFTIRKLRKDMSDKLITKKIIIQYFELFDSDVDFDIIEKYFNLKKGSLFLQDFISILMLLNHHQHINLSLGFFLELNPFIRNFEHSLFLQKIDKLEKPKLKSYNQQFEFVSKNFLQGENVFKIQFESKYKKNEESNFSIAFLSQFDTKNFDKMQNRGSFTLQKHNDMIMFKLIDQPVDCHFFDELFQIEEFELKTTFESNMTFDRLLNSGDQTIKDKSEFSLKIHKKNWNQNLQSLYQNVFKSFLTQYQNEKVLKLQEFLNNNIEGKVMLDEKSKFKFIDEIFKREDLNEVNLVCSLLLDILDYSLEQAEGEKKNIIKQLSRNQSKFFVAQFNFYGLTFELSIAQENCQSIFQLLELKLEDFQEQKQIDSNRNMQIQNKINKEMKIDELKDFTKQYLQAQDTVSKQIQKKYQSNKGSDIYDIKSEKHIRLSLNQIYKDRFSNRRIDDYLDKTGDNFQKKNQVSADNFEQNQNEGSDGEVYLNKEKNQNENYQKNQHGDNDQQNFRQDDSKFQNYSQKIDKKYNLENQHYHKKDNDNDDIQYQKQQNGYEENFNKRDQNEIENYIDPNTIVTDNFGRKQNQDDSKYDQKRRNEDEQFDQKYNQNQNYQYLKKGQEDLFNQTQRKHLNQTEIASKSDQFKDQLYRKKMLIDIYSQNKSRLKFNRLVQSLCAFLSLFHRIRRQRRLTRKTIAQQQIAQCKQDPELFMSFAEGGSQKIIRRFKLKPIAFSIKIWLQLYKHIQKNNTQRIFHGFLENKSQIIEYVPENKKLILKRNTIIFCVKVFVGLLKFIKKRQIIPRIRSYTGKKPLIRRGESSKLFVTSFSIKVFISLYKFIQKKKIKQTAERFQYQRAYKNIQKFKVIVKSIMVFKDFIKKVKRREKIGFQKYDRLQKVKRVAFLKVRILLQFKKMVQFTKRKKTFMLRFGIRTDLKLKLQTRFIAVQRFIALYKFVQKNRVKRQTQSYLKERHQIDRQRLRNIKAKVISINKFLFLYRFVQFQRLTRRAQTLDDFNPQKIVIVRQFDFKFGKFHATSISIMAFQKLYKKVQMQKLLPKKSTQILPVLPRTRCKVKLFYLAKSLYIFKNLYNFTKTKKIMNSKRRYSRDLDYDVKLIKKFQYFGFTIQQIVELQKIYTIRKNKNKKLSFKYAAYIVLTLNKLYKSVKINKTRAISQQVLRQTIQIEIPKFYSLQHVSWCIFGFIHLYKKIRIRKKRETIQRVKQISIDVFKNQNKRTAYPKLFAFSKFCQLLQQKRNKSQAFSNRKKNIQKLKRIIQVIMMFQSFYKEIKKEGYRQKLQRHVTFRYSTDHWLKKEHSYKTISEAKYSELSAAKKYNLKAIAQSVLVFLKLYKFIQKKRGRFIRNQTFFNKNKKEVIEFRRFSTFSARSQSQQTINFLVYNTSKFLNNSLQEIQNNPQTDQERAHYMLYSISKYIIEKNEKTIDFFIESQMEKQQDRGRKRTISFTMKKLRKSKQNIQEFDIPDIDENDEEFADVNYYNKFLNFNQVEDIDEQQIQKVRKSISQRQSKSRTYSQVHSILDTLGQDDFQVSKIKFFDINNVKRKAKLVQNQTKLHKILEKKNRTLSIRRGTVSKQNEETIQPKIVYLDDDQIDKQDSIHQQKDNQNDNIFKDDSFVNKRSIQIHNVLDYTEEISDQSAQDKSVKSFIQLFKEAQDRKKFGSKEKIIIIFY